MSSLRHNAEGGSLLWVQGLACGAILAFAPAAGVLLVVLFWPAILGAILDRQKGRPVARAMALCAAAASVQPIRTAWFNGMDLHANLAVAGDIRVLGATWAAAIGGLGLGALAPLLTRLALEGLGAARAARLKAERTRLLAAWRWNGPPEMFD